MQSHLFITSLAPNGLYDIQKRAVSSWASLGGKTISANTPQEIEKLSPLFPEVHFHSLRRDARLTAQKAVPFLDDLLAIPEQNPTAKADAFVLINADIILRHQPQTLQAAIQAARAGKLVCGARLDVDDAVRSYDQTAPVIGEQSKGYDYFVIPADLPARLPRTKLALGMPFWDYWLPLAGLLAGAPLVEEASDFALHSRHETRWSHAKFFYFSAFLNAILDQYTPPFGGNSTRDALAESMIRYEHSQLSEKIRSPSCTEQDMQALSDFYDRQFAVLVHHIRCSLTPLERP